MGGTTCYNCKSYLDGADCHGCTMSESHWKPQRSITERREDIKDIICNDLFPLTFERTFENGKALWASEIEPFPIEVTKIRFAE